MVRDNKFEERKAQSKTGIQSKNLTWKLPATEGPRPRNSQIIDKCEKLGDKNGDDGVDKFVRRPRSFCLSNVYIYHLQCSPHKLAHFLCLHTI
jgi:hypothetical protein